MIVKFYQDTCLMCDEKIKKKDRIRAHLIPKTLKPKNNIIIYLHKSCEERINELYISQQKKPEHIRAKKKMLNIIKDLYTKLRSIEKKIENDE